MISVAIIGQGNVASHLIKAFQKVKELKVVAVNSRTIKTLPKTTVCIIAVSDDAISSVSNQLKNSNSLIVHTSGSVSMDALAAHRKGVFYMLQTFTKGTAVNFDQVPFCLEANSQTDWELLERLAKLIGKKTYAINSEQRQKLHVAAVFVNNFVNHLYQIGNEICDANNIPFQILQPLIEETAKKVASNAPNAVQTGPAKRKDQQTIKNHMAQLNTEQQAIYQLLTKSIQNK